MAAESKAAKTAVAMQQARKSGHLSPSVIDARADEERKRLERYLAAKERSE